MAIAGTILIAFFTGLRMKPESWGALGQWAGAVGSVLAAVVALWIANRQAALTAAQEQVEAREKEINQARLVTAETTYPDPEDSYFEITPVTVRITNHSPEQILNPRVEGFVRQRDGTITWDIADLDGTPFARYGPAPTVLPAGQHDSVPVELRYSPEPTPDEHYRGTTPVIGFTDANGNRWRRTGAATPVRVSDDDRTEVGGPSWYRAEFGSAHHLGDLPPPGEGGF